MWRQLRAGSIGLLLFTNVAAACSVPASPDASSATPPVPSATSSPQTSASETPMPTLGPTPRASASTLASPSAAAVSEWYPWLPPIDGSVDATFEVDSFVAGRVPVVPVSQTPGSPPYRFDTGEPDPSTHPLIGFPKGMPLVVVHGPVVVDGVEWYLLAPAQLSVDVPTGWSPSRSPSGQRLLASASYDCPATPIDAAKLSPGVLTDGLPVCYGDREITIVGDLACETEADSFAVGATWLAGGTCRFDAPPTVYGLDPRLKAGRYAVTGRFLDEEATACRPADGDASDESRLMAVLHCRRAFVASSARRT